MRFGIFLMLAIAAGIARAEVRPFEVGSQAKIQAAHEGRPFILSFWSLDCPHCPKELKVLGEFKRRHPAVEIVLVSTDSPAEVSALADFASRQGLGATEQWVFADPQPEKLRFEIDKRWWGELPRTYLFDANRKVSAFSGLMTDEALTNWLVRNGIGSGQRKSP